MAAVAAHPAFTARFQKDLSTPGLRIPLTVNRDTFADAAELGRVIIWLHTFGDRMADEKKGRATGPPRLPQSRQPAIPAAGEIPSNPAAMPDTIAYDGAKKRLLIGTGYVENVEPAVWRYGVSGKQVLLQWFSYRKKNRERPIIGHRRQPSPLGDIQPDHWLAEYTTELINVLNILGWLVELEHSRQNCSSACAQVRRSPRKRCGMRAHSNCLSKRNGKKQETKDEASKTAPNESQRYECRRKKGPSFRLRIRTSYFHSAASPNSRIANDLKRL